MIRTYFRVVLLDEDDPDHNDVNEIPYGWVQVEGRNHVHDGKQIRLDIPVLMEGHHRRVGDNQGLDVTGPADRSLGTLPPPRLMMLLPSPAPLNLHQPRLRLPLEPRFRETSRLCEIPAPCSIRNSAFWREKREGEGSSVAASSQRDGLSMNVDRMIHVRDSDLPLIYDSPWKVPDLRTKHDEIE